MTSLHFKELDIIVGTEIVFSEFCNSLSDNDRKFVTLLTLITQGGGNEFFETPYPDITQYLESNFSIMLNRKDVYPVIGLDKKDDIPPPQKGVFGQRLVDSISIADITNRALGKSPILNGQKDSN